MPVGKDWQRSSSCLLELGENIHFRFPWELEPNNSDKVWPGFLPADGLSDCSCLRVGSRRALWGHFRVRAPFLPATPEDFETVQLQADSRYQNVPPSGYDALLVLALNHLSTFCPFSKASSFDDKVIVLMIKSFLEADGFTKYGFALLEDSLL